LLKKRAKLKTDALTAFDFSSRSNFHLLQ